MSERIDVFSALKNPPVKRKQWESFGSYCNFITNKVRKTAWLCETGGVVKCGDREREKRYNVFIKTELSELKVRDASCSKGKKLRRK